MGKRFIYVANADNDTITVVDARSGRMAGDVELKIPRLEGWRGVLPFGVCANAAGTTLYVACSGLNAVAVVDTATHKVRGYIPAAWFVCLVRLTPGRNAT